MYTGGSDAFTLSQLQKRAACSQETITAGSSSPLTDGAAALLLMREDKAKAQVKKGRNDFLVKITQSTAGCAASVRVLAADGIGGFSSGLARKRDLLRRKGIATLYISAYYEGNVTPERISYLRGQMDPAAPPNAELAPYVMRAVFSEWFAKFDSSPLWFMGALACVLGFYFWNASRVEFVLFSTGWMAMGSEILIIFAFQIFFGYIYFQIGIIVTVFLAGLLPGALWGRRLAARARRVLILTDSALIGLLAATFAAVHAGDRLGQAFYLVLGFAVSFACGMQFPAALRLRGDDGRAATGIFLP